MSGELYVKPYGYKYVGKFADGFELDGNGQVIYDNGDIIDGFFKNSLVIKAKLISNETTIEFGYLDNSEGNGFSTYTNEFGHTTTGIRKDGRFVNERGFYFGEDGYDRYGRYEKKYNKAYRRAYKKDGINNEGIIGYIPENIYRNLKFKAKIGVYHFPYRDDSKGEYNHLCYGFEKNKNGDIVYSGYYLSGTLDKKTGYGEFHGSEEFYPEIEYYKGMWWDDTMNGYGIMKLKNGKINKGVFSNGVFVKSEDFNMDDMQILTKHF